MGTRWGCLFDRLATVTLSNFDVSTKLPDVVDHVHSDRETHENQRTLFVASNNEMRWQKKIDYHPVIILICVLFQLMNFVHSHKHTHKPLRTKKLFFWCEMIVEWMFQSCEWNEKKNCVIKRRWKIVAKGYIMRTKISWADNATAQFNRPIVEY